MRSRATPSRISVGERVGALGAVGKASVRGLPHVGCFGCEARVPCVRVVGWSGEGAWVRVAAGWVGAVCALRTIARLPSYLFGWGGVPPPPAFGCARGMVGRAPSVGSGRPGPLRAWGVWLIDAGPGQAVGAARGLRVLWGGGACVPRIDHTPACVAVPAVGEAADVDDVAVG